MDITSKSGSPQSQGHIMVTQENGGSADSLKRALRMLNPESAASWMRRMLIGSALVMGSFLLYFAVAPQYGSREIEGTVVFYRIWKLTGHIEYRYLDGWKVAGPIFKEYTGLTSLDVRFPARLNQVTGARERFLNGKWITHQTSP